MRHRSYGVEDAKFGGSSMIGRRVRVGPMSINSAYLIGAHRAWNCAKTFDLINLILIIFLVHEAVYGATIESV